MTTEPKREPLSSEVSRLESEVGPHAHHPLVHFRLFEQLKHRNVIRVGILYLVVCWLILDPVHVLFHMLDVPVWANRLVVILMAVGFPAVLVFAWAYEITPEGLKPTAEVDPYRSIRQQTAQRLNRAIVVVMAVALAYFIIDKFWVSKQLTPQPTASAAQETAAHAHAAPGTAASATEAAFAPPPHSIAVLPFVNISGDKEQEYFSDGLTEELLNSLSRISELQVTARTSSFYFKGEHADLATIARKLNVAAVLEGSVRRSTHTVRVTAQLVNAVTGFHLWSQTYDRDVGDVLKVQTEIADAVTSALKVTLLGDVAARVELGGTRNPAAFDAYLRGLKASRRIHAGQDYETAISAYTEAIRLDPGYALAIAARSLALTSNAGFYEMGPAASASYASAQTDARRAIGLAPGLAEAHLALASVLFNETLDFARAADEYQRAMSLAPGNALVARSYARFAVFMGHTDAGIAAARRAVQLDPLNPLVYRALSSVLTFSRRYSAAIDAAQQALALDPDNPAVRAIRGLAYYGLGDYESARASCEATPTAADTAGPSHYLEVCLAMTYEKLGRHADAEATLRSVRSWYGDSGGYQYAEIYAQWGDTFRALAWLDSAMRLHDTGLSGLKIDPLLDPLRKEPRFQAIERELKFPT
jgi:TolB-like protein/tetratricopeptide (TPR) repeat protein